MVGITDYINMLRYGDGKQLDILSDNDAKSLTLTYNLATQVITGTVSDHVSDYI